MARWVFVNGVRYDESEVWTEDDVYETLEAFQEDEEEIEEVKYYRFAERRKDEQERT